MIIFGKLAINNVFNPRLREGGDSAAQLFIGAKIFQSTPPRRRRRRESSVKEGEKCFQSTPPRRRRQYGDEYQCDPAVFNPRLREGGDEQIRKILVPQSGFQSTPPRRRRPPKPTAPECFWRFQSTPPRRRRRSIQSTTSLIVTIFNPRLREGGDRNIL